MAPQSTNRVAVGVVDYLDMGLLHGLNRTLLAAIKTDQYAETQTVNVPRWNRLTRQEAIGLLSTGGMILAVLALVTLRTNE